MKYYWSAMLAALCALPLFAGVAGKVNASRLNLRTQPAVTAPVAAQVANGAELEVLAVKDNWVEVVAPHRGEAFAACQWLIDEMKRTVPIWKKPVSLPPA